MRNINGRAWELVKRRYTVNRFMILPDNRIRGEYRLLTDPSATRRIAHTLTPQEAAAFRLTAGYHVGIRNIYRDPSHGIFFMIPNEPPPRNSK